MVNHGQGDETVTLLPDGRRWLERPRVTTCDAQVIRVERDSDCSLITTRETIFFPGGGGQPADRGQVSGLSLVDVQETDDGFVHRVSGEVETGTVSLELDQPWRLELSQQHTGQHILSAVCYRRFGWQTLSFHLGSVFSTIDIASPRLSPERLREIEVAVSKEMAKALPIVVYEGEGAAKERGDLLRKCPEVTGELRVVELEGLDAVPCCGTHLETTAQAAPLLLVEQTTMRSNARLHFVCGLRALEVTRRRMAQLVQLSRLLDSSVEDVVERLRARIGEFETLARDSARMHRELQLLRLQELSRQSGEQIEGVDVLVVELDLDGKALGPVLRDFCRTPGRVIAVVGRGSSRRPFAVACSKQVPVSCNQLLQRALAPFSGSGGGGDSFAQGAVEAANVSDVLQAMRRVVTAALL